MKHLSIILFSILLSVNVHAQSCTPTWPQGGGTGVNPDSAIGLPHANEGSAYSTSINFKVPKDTTYNFTKTIKVSATIDTITIDSVHGLSSIPSAVPFTYTANPSTGIFLGDSVGCILITGTPNATSLGTYPLVVYVTAHAYLPSLGLYIMQSYTITFYKIVVDYPVGISEVIKNEFGILNSQPNPANQSANLTYYMPEHGNVNLKVYSVLGQLVADKTLNSQAGLNSYMLQTDEMPAGQYFYTMTFKDARQTRELSIVK